MQILSRFFGIGPSLSCSSTIFDDEVQIAPDEIQLQYTGKISLLRPRQHCGFPGDWDLEVCPLESGIIPSNNLKDGHSLSGSVSPQIAIAVNRSGHAILLEGLATLSAARAAGLTKICARVDIRHSIWVKFKRELFHFARRSSNKWLSRLRNDTNYNGKLYQQAYHFDTRSIPFVHGEDRLELIRDHINSPPGTVLDIGANLGAFSFGLERLGYRCTAVEMKSDDVYFMTRLRDACRAHFEIAYASIFDFKKGDSLKYDTVLALYIFHHFLKTRELFAKLTGLLERLDCAEVVLGTHDPKEAQMEKAYCNLSPRQFAEFIMSKTNLRTLSLIKEYNLGGRTLFRIAK